jgi:hypothetical protein
LPSVFPAAVLVVQHLSRSRTFSEASVSGKWWFSHR